MEGHTYLGEIYDEASKVVYFWNSCCILNFERYWQWFVFWFMKSLVYVGQFMMNLQKLLIFGNLIIF